MANSKPSSVIFVGWINFNGKSQGGETMKNQLLIERLRQLGLKCLLVDFYKWKRHPWVFLRFAYYLISHPKSTLILSTTAKNIYPLLKLFHLLRIKRNIVHWVIGGQFGQLVVQGNYKPEILNEANHTLVESDIMVKELVSCGVKGVIKVPNFKYVTNRPEKKSSFNPNHKRFLFLSRIMPEKGCDYILEATKILNQEGLLDKFSVDFFGEINQEYRQDFLKKINETPNASYLGYFDMLMDNSYHKLAEYDAMLFPTYWRSEGFPGVVCDAFIAGLPILASDWAHNTCFLEQGKTALLHPVHNVDALAQDMRNVIENKVDLTAMKEYSYNEIEKYDINNVVSPQLLKEIGIFD